MSLKPQPARPVPESVRRVAEQVLASDDLMRIIGDRLAEFVTDDDFAGLYAKEGRPGVSPALLLMVTLLQFLENLPDRATARMVAMRLDWKYALHLPLSYAGFDPSVLCEFRDRLQRDEGAGARRALDAMLSKLQQMQLLKAGGTQRTDSLSVLAAVRDLSRLELVMESVRLALRALQQDGDGLEWLVESFPAARLGEWAERYAQWTQEERLVREGGERGRREVERLASQAGEDALALLEALAAPSTPARLRTLAPVQVLQRVFEEQFEVEASQAPDAPEEEPRRVRWRQKHGHSGKGPGGSEGSCQEATIQTPHDPDARWAAKRGKGWQGYKAHLTETVSPQAPRIITDVQTAPATENDAHRLDAIQQRLQERGLLPQEHLADTTYVTGQNMAHSLQRGVLLLGPAYPDTSPQARIDGGLTQEQFEVDYARRQVRCPGGAVSVKWAVAREDGEERGVQVAFAAKDCAACALYARCVLSKSPTPQGRSLLLAPYRTLILQRRKEQQTQAFQERYRKRAGVEASLSEGVRSHGLRQARYVGLARVGVQHILVAMAMNMKRVARWLAGLKREEERPPGLRALHLRVLHLRALADLPEHGSGGPLAWRPSG